MVHVACIIKNAGMNASFCSKKELLLMLITLLGNMQRIVLVIFFANFILIIIFLRNGYLDLQVESADESSKEYL